MVDVVRVPPEAFHWGTTTGPAAVIETVRAASAAQDHNDPLNEAALLMLKNHGLANAGLWLVDGSAFALLHGELDLAVAPTARGCGFGGGLLAAALADAPEHVTAWSHGDHPAAAILAERFDFTRARELWVMRRSLSEPLPPAHDAPMRNFRPGDEADLLRVNAAAFAKHPEQGGMSGANLAERMAEPWFDPAGLLMAYDGDELLGFHWTKVHRSGAGEVYVVGIAPAAQGRGIGKALTLAGLHHLQDRGVPEVILYVESDNSTGIGLYSGLGFTHAPNDTHVQYRRA